MAPQKNIYPRRALGKGVASAVMPVPQWVTTERLVLTAAAVVVVAVVVATLASHKAYVNGENERLAASLGQLQARQAALDGDINTVSTASVHMMDTLNALVRRQAPLAPSAPLSAPVASAPRMPLQQPIGLPQMVSDREMQGARMPSGMDHPFGMGLPPRPGDLMTLPGGADPVGSLASPRPAPFGGMASFGVGGVPNGSVPNGNFQMPAQRIVPVGSSAGSGGGGGLMTMPGGSMSAGMGMGLGGGGASPWGSPSTMGQTQGRGGRDSVPIPMPKAQNMGDMGGTMPRQMMGAAGGGAAGWGR